MESADQSGKSREGFLGQVKGFYRSRHDYLNPIFLLSVFWLILIIFYGYWLKIDQGNYPWDMSIHAKASFRMWEQLSRGRLQCIYTISDYYPPLFYLFAAPFSVLSSAPAIYCCANWLMLLATMLGTWLLAKRMLDNSSAVCAATLVPAYLYVSRMCLMPMIDLSLTAVVVWTLAIIIDAGLFHSTRKSHLLGLLIGLGLLAKWPYVFFAALPIFFAAWRHLTRSATDGEIKSRWKPIVWLIIWPLILAGPWYARAIPAIYRRIPRELGGMVAKSQGDPSLISFSSVWYYPKALYHDYMQLPLAALLLVGLSALAYRYYKKSLMRREAPGWRILGITTISAYVAFTLISNKDPRFIMPLIPILAIASTHWLGGIRIPNKRIVCVAVMIMSLSTVAWNLFIHAKPSRFDTKTEEAAAWLVSQRNGSKEKLKVLVIPNNWNLNASALDYALYRRDCTCHAQYARKRLNKKTIKSYHYILITEPVDKDDGVAPFVGQNTSFVQQLNNYKSCATFIRSDRKKIVLLKKTD